MRIAFLVLNLDGMGGTSRSAITQASALARDHDVRIVSVHRSADRPHYDIDERVRVDHLVDLRPDVEPALLPGLPGLGGAGPPALDAATTRRLHTTESALVPRRWDRQFSALDDVALEAALPHLDVDVLVTVTPGLLACAVQLLPDRVTVVHQEHRSSSDRTSGLEPLLAYAPRADLVALLTPTVEQWLRDQLGDLAPRTVVVPNPLPLGFTPRSRLDRPVLLTGGRLAIEKQFDKLVAAFGAVADQVPDWRLRICGQGPARAHVVGQVRRWDLWDRVELPGAVPDMRDEWARASVAALTSRAEGFPLVVQEAMAAGVPVVSFDSPSGPREIIDHDVNGLLVAPGSVAGMSAALLRMCTDDDLRRRLGRGALHTAAQYDAHALAERWTGLFTDARAARAGRGRLTGQAVAAPAPAAPDPTDGLEVGDLTPARARHEALTWAVDVARRSTDTWLVVPPHEHPTPVVVLPMEARDTFLRTVGGPGCPAYLSLRDPAENGWHERRGRVGPLAEDLRHGRTSSLHLEPWPTVGGRASVLAEDSGVEVQFWETAVDGTLVAPRRNPYADRLDPALVRSSTVEVEVSGVTVPTLPLMAAPTVTECGFPVDVVYTWVDGRDPAWARARSARLAALGGAAADTAQDRASSGIARYLDRGELRYSMRSLHLFAPWVRRIHLVTAGQTPTWLDPDHPQVNLVDHRDILPADALPTFSSHAIETALHRIDGLAEHFVYLNDDMMLGRPVRPERFFTPAGLPSVFLSPTALGLEDDPDAPPFLQAAWHNRRLLREAFGAVITHNLAHAPYAHTVPGLEALAERFPQALADTARSPFRSDDDVSTLSSLAQHHGLVTGGAVTADADLAFVNLARTDLGWHLRKLHARDHDFICLGDHHDHALRRERLDELLTDFFTTYYPVAAPWELG